LTNLVRNYPDDRDYKEKPMSDAAENYPNQTREDRYFEVLEDFLRTSAGYFDVDATARLGSNTLRFDELC